jgi:hypothetical protein
VHPRDQLEELYRQLLVRFRERFPDGEPPVFPETTDLNTCVAVNQQLVAKLNNRPPITLTVKKEPFLIPLKEDENGSGKVS